MSTGTLRDVLCWKSLSEMNFANFVAIMFSKSSKKNLSSLIASKCHAHWAEKDTQIKNRFFKPRVPLINIVFDF